MTGVPLSPSADAQCAELRARVGTLLEWPCEGHDCAVTLEQVDQFETSGASGVWYCGTCREKDMRAAQAHERARLAELVLAFAQNKMHAPWLKELRAMLEAAP